MNETYNLSNLLAYLIGWTQMLLFSISLHFCGPKSMSNVAGYCVYSWFRPGFGISMTLAHSKCLFCCCYVDNIFLCICVCILVEESGDDRLGIVKELLRTEDTYLENLRNIFDIYMEPLK